eukprot:1209074-Amorphochlora_amoeboformis.AAC.1
MHRYRSAREITFANHHHVRTSRRLDSEIRRQVFSTYLRIIFLCNCSNSGESVLLPSLELAGLYI